MSAWKVCLCAVILALSSAYAQATMIDSFSVTDQALFVDPYGSGQTASSSLAAPDAIGGFRDVALQWISGSLDFADVVSQGSMFSFTQGTAVGQATITWDGALASNVYSLGANLDGNEFLIDVLGTTGTGVELTMTVYTDATHASTYSTFVPGGYANTEPLLYTGFTQLGGAAGPANFANVGAIVLNFNGTGNPGSDITIGSLQTNTQTVPEPSTLALAAIGAMAFLGFGRRRRRA
jgi:hypothetical protein